MPFYCVLGENDLVKARMLRKRVAEFVLSQDDYPVLKGDTTPQKLSEVSGWEIDKYLKEVATHEHWGVQVELIFCTYFAQRVQGWQEYVRFGEEGPVHHLLSSGTHYDTLVLVDQAANELSNGFGLEKLFSQPVDGTTHGQLGVTSATEVWDNLFGFHKGNTSTIRQGSRTSF